MILSFHHFVKEFVEMELHIGNFNRDMRSLGCSWKAATNMIKQGRAIKKCHEEGPMTSNIGCDAGLPDPAHCSH
jgi:hypothetical protein